MNGFMYCGSRFNELRHLTNEDGLLVVSQGGGTLADDEEARFYVCRMDWSRKEPEQLEEEYTAVCEALRSLAEIYRMEELPFGTCPAPEYVSDDSPEMKAWSTYLKDFDAPQDPEKCEDPEPENRYSDEIREALFDLAEARIGKGADRRQTWRTWNRGMRYCRFLEIGVPSVIIKKEEEDFAVDFALHACAKEIRSVNLYKDCYDPETHRFGEVDDAEMIQLCRYLEASPHLLQEKEVGYLLLLSKIYPQELTKLWDITLHDFISVTCLCGGLLGTLSQMERMCLEAIYGLSDGTRHSEADVGANHSMSGGKVYELEAKAIRKLRHPSRRKEIHIFLEEAEYEE